MRGVDGVQVSAGEGMSWRQRRTGLLGMREPKGGKREDGKKAVQYLDLCKSSPAPSEATPLTTTWLQRTADSFTHTASKISSCPKLHSRAALCGKQGGGVGGVGSVPTALQLHHDIVNCCPEDWASSYHHQAFSGAVASSIMSFLASMSNV